MVFGLLITDIVLFVLLPFIIFCVLATDNKFWAGILTIFGAGFLVYENWYSLSFDGETIMTLLTWSAMWLGAGAVFSFFKWKMYSRSIAKQLSDALSGKSMNVEYEKALKEYVGRHGSSTPGADEYAKGVVGTIRQRIANEINRASNILKVEPKEKTGWSIDYKAGDLAEYATSWILWWPFYMVLLVLDDFVRHLIDWFLETFGQAYRRIASSSFSHID